MSSANGSTAVGAQKDSIPIDVDGSSMSIYSDEDGESEYGRSSQYSEDAASSIDYSSVSRTYLSQSRKSGMRANSEDYTGTASYYSNPGDASNSYTYDDDYSSGYGSLTYGDSALRSPQSELSSTFASLYYENPYVVNTRATLHFLRRPLYYLAFTTAGSSAVGSVFRLATTFAKRFVSTGTSIADSPIGAYPGSAARCAGSSPSLPSGYPNVPEWLRDVRASLPRVMEAPAAWMLHRYGIPVLSEVMQRQEQESAAATAAEAAAAMAAHVSSGTQEVLQAWQKTGPAIPVALFLPIFSVVVFKVAQHVRPNTSNITEVLQTQQDADGVSMGSTYPSTASPARRSLIMDASPIHARSSSPGSVSVPSETMDALTTSRGTVSSMMNQPNTAGAKSNSQAAALSVPPVKIDTAINVSPAAPRVEASGTNGVSPSSPDDNPADLRGRSRSVTQAPLTHRHVADAVAQRADGETDKVTDVNVANLSPLSPSPPPPAEGDDHGLAGKSHRQVSSAASQSVSPQPRMPQTRSAGSTASRLVSVKEFALRGDVVAAVAGAADAQEANVAFVAAVRYGCSIVILPSSLRNVDGLLEAPPSLTVEFTDDVVATATILADRRSLTLVGVTAQQWDAQGKPLDTFAHPRNALYVFVAQESSSPAAVADVAELVVHSVFVGTSRAEVPVNQVFYDRLLKEKAVEREAAQGPAKGIRDTASPL
ncbi:hypothetical protein JKF63_04081 [Porcisia hertigi]|uniref:Uncharacterized protein n=1 Tax=Porcisia hertigi TaxID=2761500 RepID=A0A836IB02_9TRYP|nr:hypothetical protein JKF63_04081 [Porcisia hertigi]